MAASHKCRCWMFGGAQVSTSWASPVACDVWAAYPAAPRGRGAHRLRLSLRNVSAIVSFSSRVRADSLGRHSFVGQLLDGLRRLCEIGQTHAPQDMWRFGELDVVISDHLDAVAPRVEEVQKAPWQDWTPAAVDAARTASLSSTTSPK